MLNLKAMAVTSNKASLLCTWGNKSNRRLFLHPPGIQVRHKMWKKRKKKKECVHVKQPTQSVPQSKVLSIKIALNVHGALHMGIVLFQYSSAVFIFFFFFNCRPLRHSVVGKLVKVSFSNFRKTNWLHSEIRHLVITIVLPAICVWTYHNCGIQDEETRLMCLLL